MKIIKFRFQGLWSSEYPLVVSRLIDIAEKHNPHAIGLGVSFDRLAAFRPQLEKIKVQERDNSESARLSELDQQRDTLCNVVYATAKNLQRAPVGEVSNDAHKIVNVFKKHGSDIPAANYIAETKRLFDLVADINAQPEVMKALENLSLMTLFVRMNEVNHEFDALFMERQNRRAETERMNIPGIRAECDKAITLLWNAIEFCIADSGAENYVQLVNAINEQNAYCKQLLAARATRRKAKQDVSKEKPIEI